MSIEFLRLKVKKGIQDALGTKTGLTGDYTGTFVGEDGYEYHIHGNEIVTVRVEIGVPWLAADSNLEKVGETS